MADETAKTVSTEEFTKLDERAKKFEAQTVDLQKQLERFKGIDPDGYKAMKEDYDSLRKEGAGTDSAKLEKLLADKEAEAGKRYGQKITELEQEREATKRELKQLRVTKTAMSKAAALFTDDSLGFIEREVNEACDWEGDTIIVRDENGKAKPSEKDPRKNMTIDEYLEGLAGKHPSIAKSNASGGGMRAGTTKPATVGASGLTLEKYKQMTNTERAKLPVADRVAFSTAVLKDVQLGPKV